MTDTKDLQVFTSLNGIKYRFNHNEIEFDYCSLCKYLEHLMMIVTLVEC